MEKYHYIPILLCACFLCMSSEASARNLRWSAELSPDQEEKALQIMQEASPKILAMRSALKEKILELKNFAYDSNEGHQQLAQLGYELQKQRQALQDELRNLDQKLMQEVGVSLHGYRGRDCNDLTKSSEIKKPSLQKYSTSPPHHTE